MCELNLELIFHRNIFVVFLNKVIIDPHNTDLDIAKVTLK